MRAFLVSGYFIMAWALRIPVDWARRSRVSPASRVERDCVLIRTTIGRYTYVGRGVQMNATDVGNYCSIASGTKVGGMEHAWWWGSTSPRLSSHHVDGKTTSIEDDVWIGANAVVRQGVRLGRGSVVGAGAVVLENVEPFMIVAGVPARPIRRRFGESTMLSVLATRFWVERPARARELLDAIPFDSPRAGR